VPAFADVAEHTTSIVAPADVPEAPRAGRPFKSGRE
jgi:hypothetical protein